MKQSQSKKDIQTKTELNKINDLLRDSLFAVKVAGSNGIETSDYNSKQIDTASEQTVTKPFKEEKIAINLAGFYAVVCGVSALSVQTNKKPVTILKNIVEQRLDSSQIKLLNRFANATWKASQPFRDWSRIKRDNFIVFTFLSDEEIEKDYDQVLAASILLFTKVESSEKDSKEQQLQQMKQLLQDTAFAYEMATHIEAAYYKGQHQPVPPFISTPEDTAIITKTKKDESLANSMTDFYAITCGVEYLSKTRNQAPSSIVRLIVNNSLEKEDRELLQRFADATAKIAQAFINLDSITRNEFVPFDLLPPDSSHKNWTQIQNAARLLQPELQ